MQYLEPFESLKEKDRGIVRALNSLKEEVEAVAYYHQRACLTEDGELRELFVHSRDEEVEHIAMLLEWLRKNMETFDKELKTYLFSGENILALEKKAVSPSCSMSVSTDGSLGIGDMRQFDPENPITK